MNVRLVQSQMFPNVWSIAAIEEGALPVKTWRDSLIANGAIAAEEAVHWARDNDHRIVRIDRVAGVIIDPRSGRQVDGSDDVIAGIEYRSRRGVIDPSLVLPDGTEYEARGQYDDDGRLIVHETTCGECGFTWNDALITSLTPVPAGRCPNEYGH